MSPHPDRRLSAYIDQELLPDEMEAVQRHLAACERCRGEVERLQQTRALLSRLPDRPLLERFWPDLRGRVGEETAPLLWERLGRVFGPPRVAIAAAAVLVVLLAIPFLWSQVNRLRAAEFGTDLFLREHVISAASDPLVDRAYLGLLMTDANLALIGERPEEDR